jgi:hypothetical protein
MKAYKLFCANNTEAHPVKLGYANFQLKELSLNAQVVDRRAVCTIPDSARTPLIGTGLIALNIGSITNPEWRMCKAPLKAHNHHLYVETKHIDYAVMDQLEKNLKSIASDYIVNAG